MSARIRIYAQSSFCLLILLLILACTAEEPQTSFVPEDYENWESTHTGYLDYRIAGHTAPVRRIRINATGAAFSDAPPPNERYPEGTIFLKENYTAVPESGSDTPAALTIMIKDRTSPDAVAGWIWVSVDQEGEENTITGKFCVACHQSANTNHKLGSGNPEGEFRDYIFYPPFAKPTQVQP